MIEIRREPSYKLVGSGDGGLLVEWPDAPTAAACACALRDCGIRGLVEAIPAYHRVGLWLEPGRFDEAELRTWLDAWVPPTPGEWAGTRHVVPCVYDGPDLADAAGALGLTRDELVRLHTSVEYEVLAVGFSPGFPYLGPLPEQLRGVRRRDVPRVAVEAGSVGLAGAQTGIYPQRRPGGWALIGRTNMAIVDVEREWYLMCVGDKVRFEEVGAVERVY